VVTAKVDRDPANGGKDHVDFDKDHVVLDDVMDVNEDNADTNKNSNERIPIPIEVNEENIPMRACAKNKDSPIFP
jgi:hypothetical protein